MRTESVRPFLLPCPEAVRAHAWQDAGGSPLLEHVDYWDSAMDLTFTRLVVVDVDAIRTDCRLPDDSQLAVSSTWHSNSTRVVGRATPVELGSRAGTLEVPVRITVPGDAAGGTVKLRTRIVLRHPGSSTHELSPTSPGAVLWADEQQVVLEGSAGRFPMAVVDFRSTAYPSEAAWALSWGGDRLHEPVLGDFRLLLNESHPTVVGLARSGAQDPRAQVLRSVLEYEVMRLIVHAALSDDSFVEDPEQYEDGTVGHLAHGLVSLAFSGWVVRSLGELERNTPERIDTELQAYSGLLR